MVPVTLLDVLLGRRLVQTATGDFADSTKHTLDILGVLKIHHFGTLRVPKIKEQVVLASSLKKYIYIQTVLMVMEHL